MSNRETSPEIGSLAGRILAAGNPLDNEQVMAAIYEGLPLDLRPTHNRLREALAPALEPYFDNMMKLAGSCLSQVEEDDDEAGPRIAVNAIVSWDKITNAIIGAFEGGSTYWLRDAEYMFKPEGLTEAPLYADDKFWAKGGKMRLSYDNPDSPGDVEKVSKEVSLIEIKAGLRSMAEHASRHFGDLVSENDDAITHDVFIQHVLFGEVIYG